MRATVKYLENCFNALNKMFVRDIPEFVTESVKYITYQMNTMKGGGYSKPSGQKRSIYTAFKKTGWTVPSLDARLGRLTNDMIVIDIQNDEYIRGFGRQWFDEQGFDTSVEQTLLNMGIDTKHAQKAEEAVGPLYNTCYTDSQLVQIAIQYLMGYYKPLAAANRSHYYKPKLVNEWILFQKQNFKPIPIMNISAPCSKQLSSSLAQHVYAKFENNRHTLFYHTSSWESCLRIMIELRHTAGNKCMDFGVTPSFYVSDSIVNALDWGEKKSNQFGHEVATLLFSLPNQRPSHLRYKVLEGPEWSSAMIKSRKCVKLKIGETNIAEVSKYDLVYGDMLANPQPVVNGAKPVAHSPPKKQLASKSEAGDKFLQSCIVGCVFFKKI